MLIANPSAGGGKVGRNWETYRNQVEAHFPTLECLSTSFQGHGRELAAKAAQAGATRVLSLGGDGTHNEILNGLMEGTPHGERPPQFGILPAGTGGDFRKVLYTSLQLSDCLEAMANRPVQSIDIGLVEFNNHNGAPLQRYFLNIASVGIGGLIDDLVNKSSKRLGGRISFLIGTLKALFLYRAPELKVELDGNPIFQGRVTNVLACNGRYAGGGMYFAPKATLNSGKLSMVVIPKAGLVRQLTLTPKLYDGSYLAAEEITGAEGKVITVSPADNGQPPAFLDIDGEAPGIAPASFTVVPGAIDMLGVPESSLSQTAASDTPN